MVNTRLNISTHFYGNISNLNMADINNTCPTPSCEPEAFVSNLRAAALGFEFLSCLIGVFGEEVSIVFVIVVVVISILFLLIS